METSTAPGPARGLAVAAFLALLSSLWLPWYLVHNVAPDGTVFETLDAGLFRPAAVAEPLLVHAAGVLVVAAALLLFVRVAGQSWRHEPHLWRRDLRNATALVAGALVLAVFWPDAYPSFWGTLHYTTDAGDATVRTLPGLGWWLGVLALVLSGGATLADREPAPKNGK